MEGAKEHTGRSIGKPKRAVCSTFCLKRTHLVPARQLIPIIRGRKREDAATGRGGAGRRRFIMNLLLPAAIRFPAHAILTRYNKLACRPRARAASKLLETALRTLENRLDPFAWPEPERRGSGRRCRSVRVTNKSGPRIEIRETRYAATIHNDQKVQSNRSKVCSANEAKQASQRAGGRDQCVTNAHARFSNRYRSSTA